VIEELGDNDEEVSIELNDDKDDEEDDVFAVKNNKKKGLQNH